MKSGLKSYVSKYEDELNIPLIDKSADRPLVDYVVDAWKSLEVVEQIHFDGYEYTENESEIDENKFMFKREKKKKKKDRYDTKLIADSRCGLLTVHLTITMLEKDPTTGEKTYQVYPISKSLLVPLQDPLDGTFYVKGKKYYMIYQLLESSTYTSANSVTLKSLMPIAIKRCVEECEDTNGNKYSLPYYTVFVFRKEIPVILFYLSHGIDFTLDYLDINHVISFMEKLPESAENDDLYLYFQLSGKCFLRVYKDLFEKYPYIQGMVGSFCNISTNRVTMAQLDEPKFWIKRIPNPNNYEKGLSIVKYFNRMLDETTKKVLDIPEYYRTDIYALIKWLMQNFNELRLKDNCDLRTKRLRCNEYIASLLTKEFSTRLNRIIKLADKVTIDNIREIFRFPGELLLQQMHKSGINVMFHYKNSFNCWELLLRQSAA